MPIISVIVPVYNVEKYLARCLDSILNQTFTDFEVICINDGSKDSSLSILKEYAQKDARIIVLDQENQGQSVARNRGLEIAQGEYISFVDSDDAIEKQSLEIAYTLATKEQADLIVWRTQLCEISLLPHTTYNIDTINLQKTQNPLFFQKNEGFQIGGIVCARLYTKKLLQNMAFIPSIYYEDEAFIYEILLRSPNTIVLNIPLYLQTINPGSTTRQKVTMKHITSHHALITHIYTLSVAQNSQAIMSLLIHSYVSRILHAETTRIQTLPIHEQLPFWRVFEEQLQDYTAKNILPLHSPAFKKKYSIYHYILTHGAATYYEKNVLTWKKKIFFVKHSQNSRTYYTFGLKIFSKQKLSVTKRAVNILGLTFTYTKK